MGKRRSINITRIKYKDKLILDEYCLVADSPLVITEENVKKEMLPKIISGEAFICEDCLNKIGIKITKLRGKDYSSLCKCSNDGCNKIGSYLTTLDIKNISLLEE